MKFDDNADNDADDDLIILECPVCGEETDFEILKYPPDAVVRCTECGHTMRTVLKEPKVCRVRAVVSFEHDSEVGTIDLIEGDVISVGDYLAADIGDESYSVEVTSVEVGDARRNKVKAEKIDTLWTRLVDKVVIRASLNKGAVTIPLYEMVEGEREYTVNKIVSVGGRQFRVTRIRLRKGGLISKEGKSAQAYEIKRIYGERS